MAKKLTKRQSKIKEINDKFEEATIEQAIDALKGFAQDQKFDHTLELAAKLGIDTKSSDQQVRASVSLPAGTGKKVVIAVIAKGEKVKEAQDAGADFVGTEDLAKKIEEGWMDFDVLVATPDCMPMLGKLGRILGPRGKMPNPKDGTVTPDVQKAVKDLQAGKVAYRAEKTGAVVHAPFGKASFSKEDLVKNFNALVHDLNKNKPASAKGTYIQGLYVSTTQGPGLKIARESISAATA